MSELFSWGTSNFGTLGLNDPNSRSSPTQVGALTDWAKIACGNVHGLAIKGDGTLWSWGENGHGRLGLGDTVDRSSPVQVGGLSDWSRIAAGGVLQLGVAHSLAVKTDGTLWAWGANTYGRLGLGTTTSHSSPVQVGLLTDWDEISAGSANSFAIKTDNSLWAWGLGELGKLGLGDTSNRSSPVQIGLLTDWRQVSSGGSHTMAIKTDGTLWAWGASFGGQLGLGDTISRSSPVQVGGLSDWANVSACNEFTLAIKTDGTLWTWGENGFGALGLSDLDSRSSPVQVGGLNNWLRLFDSGSGSGVDHVLAIKTDGTLWVWGRGTTAGEHGLGDVSIHRSSPVQVGTLTTWGKIDAGNTWSLALTGNSIVDNTNTTDTITAITEYHTSISDEAILTDGVGEFSTKSVSDDIIITDLVEVTVKIHIDQFNEIMTRRNLFKVSTLADSRIKFSENGLSKFGFGLKTIGKKSSLAYESIDTIFGVNLMPISESAPDPNTFRSNFYYNSALNIAFGRYLTSNGQRSWRSISL